ncbi:MAG: putative DNA binding domain-containing protein, partial [Pseudomonadales bacterium]|nr:putative DNA binding domain-containing protein [Pseudomonadales bacterium]
MRSAIELLDELNAVDESTRIEAKRASDVGKSILETVIAFANEPGLDGGYLLLGVDWSINDKGDTVYRATGLPNPDKVQRDLASQCASTLNVAVRPEMQVEQINGCALLVVYVPEADVTHKPIYKKATGLPHGAWRRIGSSDQRCVDEDLWVLRGESQPLHGPDSSILPDARLDDFDPVAITAYRRDRAHINPRAEELAYGFEELLEAVGARRRVNDVLQPTLAGIVLFGKAMALRRLLPMVYIDYIRVPGNAWMDDPENRFQSIDIRKPLLLALPQAEASIIDELPKGFHLPEGQLHSVQEPIVPRKVIREALANAAMHRNYALHSPTQIIRYSNRIEIRNVGYSLKDSAQLGLPGSRLRNPAIATVLHDLHLAEAKGTGIRAMRRLAAEAGLPLPEFHSDRSANEFRLTLFLHNLLTQDDYAWLRDYAGNAVSADEAKVLIYARATGAVDNTACRDFCGSDTLGASLILRRLRDRGLLVKQGAGNRTYYTLNLPDSPAEIPTSPAEHVGISSNPHKLDTESPEELLGISANPQKLDLESPEAL